MTVSRVDPYLCSELAPVLEGSGSHGRYPQKGTSVDRVSVVFVARVDRRIFLLFAKKRIRGGGAFPEGNSAPLKAKMWAISSDTHQLHYIPKHHFII